MNADSHATAILARVIGPIMAIMGLAIVVRPGFFVRAVDAFAADPLAPLVWGFIALTMGLTILAFHQRWRGAVAIAITLIGWLLVVRGVVLLFVVDQLIGFVRSTLAASPQMLVVPGAVMILIGAWLSFAGFRARIVVPS